jgi:hypothetical protein
MLPLVRHFRQYLDSQIKSILKNLNVFYFIFLLIHELICIRTKFVKILIGKILMKLRMGGLDWL